MRKKTIGLSLGALLALVTGALYFYVLDIQRLELFYRCLQNDQSVSACYAGKDFDFTTNLYGMQYEGNTKDLIDKTILMSGSWEARLLHFMRDVMESLHQNQGVFLDVGANKGVHSLFMSRYATAVHAFDPYEPVLEKFRRAVKVNGIQNIVIHAVGLGSENASIPFYESPKTNEGMGSFVETFSDHNTFYRNLQIVVGDEWLEKFGVSSVAVVKIDIEGFEKPALEGLSRTLKTNRPVVVFELSIDPDNPVAFKSKEDLQASFPEAYSFLVFPRPYDESRRGRYQLRELDTIVQFQQKMQHDVVAYPLEKEGRLPRKNLH